MYTEPSELARVTAAIADVTALIEAHCRRTFTEVPAAVKAVAAGEVILRLNVDPGIQSERVGELSTSYSGSGMALSSASKAVLKSYRRSSFGTIRLVRPPDAYPSPIPSPIEPQAPEAPGVTP
ncbi:hypothetical protein ACFVH6_25740 [Spirillospora sp. NPDC127200]